jgi:hypothetical protein
MFAESPGIYGLEHPTYDVWLTQCEKPSRTIAEQTPGSESTAPPPDAATGQAAEPSAGAAPDNGREAPADQDFRRRVRR